MRIAIHKQTYADGRAYRYQISDEAGNLLYVAEPSGLLLPTPTRLVEFFDPGHRLIGRLQPPHVAPWRRGTRYKVFLGEEVEEPYAVIQEQWRLVDVLLLRLPRYQVQVEGRSCVARGSRYGERYYEIFQQVYEEQVDEEKAGGEETPTASAMRVGEIQRPASGPNYVVEIEAEPFDRAFLVLAALAILTDMELYA